MAVKKAAKKAEEVKEASKPKPKGKPSQEMEEDFKEEEKTLYCSICSKSFKNGQALGGHMSKRHLGESEAYQKKV